MCKLRYFIRFINAKRSVIWNFPKQIGLNEVRQILWNEKKLIIPMKAFSTCLKSIIFDKNYHPTEYDTYNLNAVFGKRKDSGDGSQR